MVFSSLNPIFPSFRLHGFHQAQSGLSAGNFRFPQSGRPDVNVAKQYEIVNLILTLLRYRNIIILFGTELIG